MFFVSNGLYSAGDREPLTSDISFPNLINAAVDICLQDSSVSTMPSREELCRRVKEYLEGIAKMKKKTKEERRPTGS